MPTKKATSPRKEEAAVGRIEDSDDVFVGFKTYGGLLRALTLILAHRPDLAQQPVEYSASDLRFTKLVIDYSESETGFLCLGSDED